MLEERDWYADICVLVAEALGPAILERWKDGDATLNLGDEIRRLRNELAD